MAEPHEQLLRAIFGIPTMDTRLAEDAKRPRPAKKEEAPPLPADAHSTLYEALSGAAVGDVPPGAHARLAKVLMG